MNKDLLYKYFRNEASAEEVDRIIRWVESSQQNLDFFAEQKALWDVSAGIKQPKIIRRKSNRMGLRIAYFSAAAVVTVLLASNLFLMLHQEKPVSNPQPVSLAALPAEQVRTLYTEKGVKARVVLPDSSVVWLNSDSRICYPSEFARNVRQVEMSGEAYFEVMKDSLRPMIVKTNKDFTIEVLGTCFSVKSYDNDNVAKATLFTGAISMHYKDTQDNELKVLKLKPEESFIYYQASAKPKPVRYKDNSKEIAWKNGELYFDQTPMEEVLKMLERWHGTRFIVQNKAIYNDKLTASFQTESIVQVMEMIKYCINMDYSIKNNIVTIK